MNVQEWPILPGNRETNGQRRRIRRCWDTWEASVMAVRGVWTAVIGTVFLVVGSVAALVGSLQATLLSRALAPLPRAAADRRRVTSAGPTQICARRR